MTDLPRGRAGCRVYGRVDPAGPAPRAAAAGEGPGAGQAAAGDQTEPQTDTGTCTSTTWRTTEPARAGQNSPDPVRHGFKYKVPGPALHTFTVVYFS